VEIRDPLVRRGREEELSMTLLRRRGCRRFVPDMCWELGPGPGMSEDNLP